MDYIFSKKVPEVGDRGFIVGDRFVKVSSSIKPDYGLITWLGDSFTSLGEYQLTLNVSGNVTITEDGFCFPGSDSAGLSVTLPNELDLSGSFQLEFDALLTGNTWHFGFFRLDSWNINVASIQSNNDILYGQPNSINCSVRLETNIWNHYVWRRLSNNNIQFLMNNVIKGSTSSSKNYTGKELCLNAKGVGFSTPFQGYIKNFKISYFDNIE